LTRAQRLGSPWCSSATSSAAPRWRSKRPLTIAPEPAGTQGYEDLRRRARNEPIGQGLRPQVAAVDDLARMLTVLNRDRDRELLRTMQRVIELRPEIRRGLDRGIDI